MPTYEYVCRSCDHRFERRQSIHADPLATCPRCGGPVDRLVSGGAGFFVKGGTARPAQGHAGGCSFESTGTTCCGRNQRCGAPPCQDE